VNVQFFARPVGQHLFGFGSDLQLPQASILIPFSYWTDCRSNRLYPHHRINIRTMQAKEPHLDIQEVRSVGTPLTSRTMPITTVAPRTLTV